MKLAVLYLDMLYDDTAGPIKLLILQYILSGRPTKLTALYLIISYFVRGPILDMIDQFVLHMHPIVPYT